MLNSNRSTAHKARSMTKGIVAFFLLCFCSLMLFPTHALAQSPNTKKLEQELNNASTAEERCAIYPLLLDEIYTYSQISDTYRSKFLQDAEASRNSTNIIIACREICDSYNYNLILRAEKAISKLKSNNSKTSIQTMLKCHLFWTESLRMSSTKRQAELKAVLNRIYSNKAWSSPNEEYFYNFKAYALHQAENDDAPLEPYIVRMNRIARSIEGERLLTIHSDELSSDLFVKTSQFVLGRALNERLLEDYEKKRERMQNSNRIREFDIADFRAATRLLICIFEMEHRVDESIAKKIIDYLQSHTIPENAKDCFSESLPIYIAIYNGKMDEALAMVREMENKKWKERRMYGFEQDLAVTVYWHTGNIQEALNITNQQIEEYTADGKKMEKRYLNEMGLNEEWLDIDRQNKLMQLEREMAAYQLLQDRDSLDELKRLYKADSLNFIIAKTQKEEQLRREQAIKETKYKRAQTEQETLSRTRLTLIILFFIICLLILVSLIPYIIHLRRMNKALSSEHKRLRITTDKANQSKRLKVFFLQNTSHDIRNPLGAIGSMSEMMCSMVENGNDESLKECAQLVNSNTEALTQMMNTILEISALESGRRPIVWEDASPVSIVKEMILNKKKSIDKPIDIRLETDLPDDYLLHTDNQRLRQVFKALFNNARKFTEEGSITMRMSESEGNFIFEIEDTGIGITKEQTELVFQRFYKANNFIPGAGLGLSLSKLISEKLCGKLWVDTSYQGGAKFVFSQPILAQQYAESKEKRTGSSSTIKSIVVALLMLCGIPIPTYAQQTVEYQPNIDVHQSKNPNIYETLRQEYEQAQNDNERINALLNLIDICWPNNSKELSKYKELLYVTAKRTKNTELMLEAARNTYDAEELKEMLKRVSVLPNSNEKLSTQVYLRLQILHTQLVLLGDDFKKQWISQALTDLLSNSVQNIYDRFYLLYGVCSAAMGTEQSEMLSRYLEELVSLAPKMPTKRYYLCSLAYQTAYKTYLSLNDKEKAAKTIHIMLKNLDVLTQQYIFEGRPYRDYTEFKLRYLNDLYFCESALTKEEKQKCYEEIKRIVESRPNILNEVNEYVAAKSQIALGIHEQRWEDARQYANLFTDKLDDILYENSTIMLRNELSSVHLEMMTQIYEKTNDLDHLLRTRIMLCETNRRTVNNMKQYNYQHFGIQLKILDAKLSQAEMLSEQEKQEAEDMLLLTEIERRQLIASRERHANMLESIRLDSLTNDTKEYQRFMQQKADETKGKTSRLRFYIYLAGFLVFIILVIAIAFAFKARNKRKKLRQVKVRLSEEMERAKKSDEESTAFLKNIRHEVATPLNVIMGMTQQMSMMAQEQDSQEMKMLSDMISENGEQLLSLINDILNLSLIQSGEYIIEAESHDVKALCDTQIMSVQHRVMPGVELLADYDIPENATITTDGVRFRQVLTNLLTNACKYTERGSIKLIVKKDKQKGYVFMVEDTGTGINPENAEKVFERYEKLGSNKQGTGLGLNISRTIIEKLGGTIYLDTSYKEGARFVFTHPLSAPENS